MIHIAGLTKRYGRVPALQDITIDVRDGRVTAILGPNGAGKTTLIKSILGLTRPDGGEIILDGERLNGDSRYRSRLGYMPQIARFPDNLTGTDLLAMLVSLRGPTASVDRSLIESFRLEPELAKPLRSLSGGNRQKVNAVLAFLFSPDLLILDEPTAGLDPVASSILKDRILADRARGRTFIVTSHIISELAELTDDVVFLLEGAVKFAGPVEGLLETTGAATIERALASLMTGAAVP